MQFGSISRPACEISESSTKTPCFKVPRTGFAHMNTFYQEKKKRWWYVYTRSPTSGYVALVSKKDHQEIKISN